MAASSQRFENPNNVQPWTAVMEFKDLFSLNSADYSKYRPTYPPALFEYLSSLSPRHSLAWDCGTGNGQAALKLAPYFDQIVATDPSRNQLAEALPHPKVVYRQQSCDHSEIPGGTVDLITVAQALHWFPLPAFYREVQRVSSLQGAHLAIWCYGLARITPSVDQCLSHYYEDVVGKFWEPERKMVDEGYRNIPFPFSEIIPPPFQMKANWDFDQLLGYLGTWSATQAAARTLKKNPLDSITKTLLSFWGGNPLEKKEILWDLSLRIGKIN